jgi:hypothetical protein
MDKSFPYVASVKNLPEILAKIKSAGAPPRFTYEFLKSNLGFGSSTDRPLIGVLKGLGFLTADGTPTSRYNEFRSEGAASRAMAAGLRDGWAEIFLSDQRAYERSSTQLQGIFKAVTGAGDAVAKKMATTFKSLAGTAEWTGEVSQDSTGEPDFESSSEERPRGASAKVFSLRHDVHIHLPPTSDVAVYTAIFRALRDELLD